MTQVRGKQRTDVVSRLRRWFRGIDPPLSEERATDGVGPSDPVESNDAMGGDPDPKRDWEHQTPTDKQRDQITALGSDPASVDTRRAAADLIDRLVERRRRSPLNPYRLKRRAEELGAEQGGDWESAHYSLLAELRLDLQQWIDSNLDSLRAKLSDSTGRLSSEQAHGPHDLVRNARTKLEHLRVLRRYGGDVRELSLGTFDGVSHILEPTPPSVYKVDITAKDMIHPPESAPIHDQSASSRSSNTARSLLNTMAILVVLEALANIVLLMRALPGGALAAFVLALLVSVINVGGIGISVGLFVSSLGRKAMLGIQRFGFATWAVLCVGFNLIAGRHREAYARVVAAIDQNPTVAENPPLPGSFLPEISYNPLTWEFEALLFGMLGTLLCSWGFAKGFGARDDSLVDEPGELSNGKKRTDHCSGDPNRHSALSAYRSVLQEYRQRVTALRDTVATWYQTLDQDRRDVSDTVSMLDEPQNRQACIDCMEHAFITAYNNSHADKISLKAVAAHRIARYPEPLLVGPSDRSVLEEATELVSKWHESGRSQFEAHITEIQEELIALWTKYEPLILGMEADGKPSNHDSRVAP